MASVHPVRSKADLRAAAVARGELSADVVIAPQYNATWSPEIEASILASLSRGASMQSAAAAAGIGRSTLYDHLRSSPTFRMEVERAREKVVMKVESALTIAASTADDQGRYNVRAMELFLYNRAPDRYRSQIDVQFKGDLTHLEEGSAAAQLTVAERDWLQRVAHARILGREIPDPPASLQPAIEVQAQVVEVDAVDAVEAELWAE